MMRPIDTAPFGAVDAPADLGAVPILQWVAIADLVVDESYQREIRGAGRKNVLAIAGAFQWIKFSPVIVSPVAGGKFAIIDGQHRVTAAALIGITDVPAQVVVADRATQARAFTAINASATRVSTLQIFAARLAAGDEVAVAVAACCAAAGVVPLRYPKGMSDLKPGETLAVGALEAVFRAHGRDVLELALRCIRETKNDLVGAVNATAVKAVAVALAEAPHALPVAAVIRAFDEFDLAEASAEARAKATRMRGISAADLLAAMISTHLDAVLQPEARP
jgi:hypothetical protein